MADPLYELGWRKGGSEWGEDAVWEDGYSYVGAVVGATYPEMGKVLRKADAEDLYPGTGLWCTGR